MNQTLPLVRARSICCALAFSLPAHAAEPALQLRWLQTDPKTADAVVKALKAKSLTADVMGTKIDQLVKGGKITEVAAFNKKLVSGERFVLKPRGKSPGMEFEFAGKLRPGVAEFVAAKTAPQKDQPVVVLVLTPWYDVIR